MKKISLILLLLLGFVVLANVLPVEADNGSDHVGVVVTYTEGQSITIVDRDGNQSTFELASQLKILPADRAGMLGPGAYVTVVTPNNVPNGKNIAVQIVVHPQVPPGFFKQEATNTAVPSSTLEPTVASTSTESPTEVTPATAALTEAVTATEAATNAPTSAVTETPTGMQAPLTFTGSAPDVHTMVLEFVNWLASAFRQFVNSGS